MLADGTRLGPYQIVSPLGAGGMGEVYRARDKRLSRDVALKILPRKFENDPVQRARFEREARAASALNHPNIIAIYDVGHENGIDFFVSELVGGESLRSVIQRGAMPVRRFLTVAVQIADALAGLHSVGLVHCDLKPGNIMLTRDDKVKLLDFGLARQLSVTVTACVDEVATVTHEGMITGTVGYMSPEQVQGRPTDHRSDIFSFGAVTYEMLVGKRAFDRGSAVETMNAILHDDPPPFPPERNIPVGLESTVRHCMEKNPEARFQSAWDLAFALEAISGIASSNFIPALPGLPRWRAKTAVAGLVFVSFVVGALVAWGVSGRFAPKYGAHLAINNLTFAQLTDETGPELFPSLSPDGKSFVYASRIGGHWNIYVQMVGNRSATNLTKDSVEDDTQPAFSPDGRYIAFRSEREGGGIFTMTADGKQVRRLTDSGFNPAWSPDGKHLIFADEGITHPDDRHVPVSRLQSVEVATGHKRTISGGDAVQPQWSPHGQRIAYWAIDKSGRRDIWTIAVDGGMPIPVTRDDDIDWNPVWAPDGSHLYFSSNRGSEMNIWRVPIQESSGKVLGPPELVSTPSAYSCHLSFSQDGHRLAYVQQAQSSSVHRVTFDPVSEAVIDEPKQVIHPSRQASRPALSSDGEWLAFNSSGVQEDLFLVRANGTGLRQLTDEGHRDRGPRWSPDGRRIAFFSKRGGNPEIWIVNADGSGLQQITRLSGPNVAWPLWSPKGDNLAYTIFGFNSFIIDLTKPWNKQSPQALPPYAGRRGSFSAWSWSPDGNRIAGFEQSDDGAYAGIVLYSVSSKSFEKLTNFGVDPLWLSDSRRLLFNHLGRIYLVDSQSKKIREILSIAPQEVARRGFSIGPHDRQIYFSVVSTEAHIWLIYLD